MALHASLLLYCDCLKYQPCCSLEDSGERNCQLIIKSSLSGLHPQILGVSCHLSVAGSIKADRTANEGLATTVQRPPSVLFSLLQLLAGQCNPQVAGETILGVHPPTVQVSSPTPAPYLIEQICLLSFTPGEVKNSAWRLEKWHLLGLPI